MTSNSQFNPLPATLNKIHAELVFKRRINVLAQKLHDVLPNSGSVLDVGCGDGALAARITEMNEGLHFSGIDVMLRPAVAIPVKLFNGKSIPIDDDAYDWVTIVDVLHHTDDPISVLKECIRVAKHGVVIKDHNKNGLLAFQTLWLMDWVGNRGHGVRLAYNYYSRGQWHKIFDELSMRVVRYEVNLGLYPQPLSAVFDRSLHFIAVIVPSKV